MSELLEADKADESVEKKGIKTDLFRFATLRGPQTLTKDRRTLGFVEHPEHAKSYFLKEINADDDIDSIRIKLQSLSQGFNFFSSVEEVKTFAGDLWKFSMWLGKNQNNLLNTIELSNNISGVTVPTIGDHLKLWDNVFYDIITRKNPHVRQACLQLLVTIHFIENYSSGRASVDYERIAKSRVIIPSYFTLKDVSASKSGLQQRTMQDSALKKQATNTEKLIAGEEVNKLNGIKEELIELDTRYQKDYQNAYDEAAAEYAEKYNDASVESPSADVAADELGEVTPLVAKSSERPDQLDDPFVFEYPLPLSKKYTSRKLSFEARYFIEEHRLTESTIQNALIILDGEISVQKKVAHQVIKASPRSIVVGGVKMKTTSTYIPTYSITTQVVPTSSGIDLKIFLTFNAGYSNAFFQSSSFKIHLNSGGNIETHEVTPQDLTVLHSTQPETLFVELKVLSFTKTEFDKNMFVSVTGDFQLDNDKSYSFASKSSSVYRGADGIAQESTIIIGDDDVVHYGINRIGVADYRKVEQELCCYIPGEVSQIENIMAREYKEKMTRNLVRSEDTVETTVENEIEELNDTTSTTRFEMNSEISEVLNRDSSANLGFSTGASGEYFGTAFSASMNGDFSTSQSSSKSDTIARTYAEDVTKRALERVVQKNTIKRTTKIIKEFEENNKHGYDNRGGSDHVTGVFRWVDKVYKNQLVNYGKRLIYEFMLPEPARYYKELIVIDAEKQTDDTSGPNLVEPTHPEDNNIDGPESIDRTNYQYLSGLYNISVPAPLPQQQIITRSHTNQVSEPVHAKTISLQPPVMIPTNYTCTRVHGNIEYGWEQFPWPESWGYIALSFGATWRKDHPWVQLVRTRSNEPFNESVNISGSVNIDVGVLRVWDFNLDATFVCELDAGVYLQWQQDVYDAIMAAYNQQLQAYQQAQQAATNDDAVAAAAAAEASILKTNPLYNKQFIMNELKRLCIEMMLTPFNLPQGKDFYYDLDLGSGCLGADNKTSKKIPQYKLSPELDSYSRQVKFFEQAFDWTILSHVFYPYYWANKCEWENLFQSQDSTDHILQEFLQSGMGRVLVPVREGFEDAVVYFMETGEIWHGTGLVLDTDDELYLSIIDETTIIEGKVEDEWETIVPTTLTLIQGKSAFLENEGLPCCEHKEHSDIKSSEAELGLLNDGGN